MIKELQRTAVLRNTSMAAATLTSAQAEAMKAAASNTSTVPMMAFAGMNMANAAGGLNANTLFNMAAQEQAQAQPQQAAAAPQQSAPAAGEWICSCGAKNSGKFCTECGSKIPEEPVKMQWFCPEGCAKIEG